MDEHEHDQRRHSDQPASDLADQKDAGGDRHAQQPGHHHQANLTTDPAKEPLNEPLQHEAMDESVQGRDIDLAAKGHEALDHSRMDHTAMGHAAVDHGRMDHAAMGPRGS